MKERLSVWLERPKDSLTGVLRVASRTATLTINGIQDFIDSLDDKPRYLFFAGGLSIDVGLIPLTRYTHGIYNFDVGWMARFVGLGVGLIIGGMTHLRTHLR